MPVELCEMVQSAARLPTPPGVVLRLVELTRCDEASLSALTDLVALDPVLTARALKAANALSRGGARDVASLTQAAEVIGLHGMKALALSFAPVAAVNDACWARFDLERFWDRSLACASAASAVAQQMQTVDPDEAYAAGLLCNFGQLLLARVYPTRYERVLARVAGSGCTMRDAEVELLPTSHRMIAAQVYDAWHLPQRLCEALAALAATDAPGSAPSLAQVIFTAESIAEQLCTPSASGGRQAASSTSTTAGDWPTDRSADAGRSPMPVAPFHLSEWAALLAQVSQRWHERRQLLAIPGSAASSFNEIEAEARQRLAEMALELHVDHRALEQRQDELLRRARTDPLTSVGNRPAFDERFTLELDRAQRTGRPIILLLADVDRFKAVNDRYGHAVGDDVLRTVARAIDEVTRSVDLVARYGGDEFAVIAPECTFAGARKLAERLRSAVEKEQMECNGRHFRVTISVGAALAQWPDHAATPDALFTAADAQLYAAKHAGRNCSRVCRVRGEAVPPPHRPTTRITRDAPHASGA